jgi:antitoxin component of MazEF toxin-antitoxin module
MKCEYCLTDKKSTKLRQSKGRQGMYYLCDKCTLQNLASLLVDVTPENKHSETDWGRPAGKERL